MVSGKGVSPCGVTLRSRERVGERQASKSTDREKRRRAHAVERGERSLSDARAGREREGAVTTERRVFSPPVGVREQVALVRAA